MRAGLKERKHALASKQKPHHNHPEKDDARRDEALRFAV
jgi:hypothetical protein